MPRRRDILRGHIVAGFAYPTSTWPAALGRPGTGAWHVSAYRGDRARPSYVRPEIIAGPFETREAAQAEADRRRQEVRATA